MPAEDKLLSAIEAAKILGVSKSTAQRLLRAGKIIASKAGTQWVIRMSDLKKYEEEIDV